MTALDQLQRVKLGDICHKNALITIDSSATVSDAISLMKSHHISNLTVLKDGAVQDFLDLRDVVNFLAWGKYKVSPSDNKPAFRDDKVDYGAKMISDLLPENSRVWRFDGMDPVQKVIEPFSKGVRRAIVMIDRSRRMLTQTDVLRWIATNHAFAPIVNMSLTELGLTQGKVITASDSFTALEAFRVAAQNEVGGVAIVDKHRRLMANLSGSDLRGLDCDFVNHVEKPVTRFLAELHPASLNPVVCHKGDSLKYVLFKMLSLRIHRVWLIDAQHVPIGVVTMSDVLSKFITLSPEMQS